MESKTALREVVRNPNTVMKKNNLIRTWVQTLQRDISLMRIYRYRNEKQVHEKVCTLTGHCIKPWQYIAEMHVKATEISLHTYFDV